MKSTCCLLLACLAGAASGTLHARVVGLKVQPSVTVTGTGSAVQPGYTGGICYDQKVYKRLGLSTGIFCTQLRARTGINGYFFYRPEFAITRFDLLELPLDLTLDLSDQQRQTWKFILTGGYGYGHVIGGRHTEYGRDRSVYEERPVTATGIRQLHFLRLGFEIKKTFTGRLNVAFGGQFRHAPTHNPDYVEFNDWGLFLKTGLHISRKVQPVNSAVQ
jgi:hypothetical protein